MRGRTKEIHKELQDLDPIGSPHLEEILIGGKIDLDLLSLFPQEDARIIRGIERKSKASRSTMEESENRKPASPRKKKGALYRSSTKTSHCWALTLESSALGAGVSGAPGSFGNLRTDESGARPELGRRLCVSDRRLWPPKNWQEHQHKNDNNLSIRTPFLMILSSLESQQ
jgi:hypothetical protein